ncbi:hypothetical protein SprV_0301297900 [Sparganum proliferum]
MQFTMEEEENNQLAFLYVLVCRKDYGGLKTSVQGSDKYDASAELQQQSPNQPQTQLCLLHMPKLSASTAARIDLVGRVRNQCSNSSAGLAAAPPTTTASNAATAFTTDARHPPAQLPSTTTHLHHTCHNLCGGGGGDDDNDNVDHHQHSSHYPYQP